MIPELTKPSKPSIDFMNVLEPTNRPTSDPFPRATLRPLRFAIPLAIACGIASPKNHAAELRAGVARMEITDRAAGPVHDPSYVKALVLKDSEKIVALITLDVVAIGGIGPIRNDYLDTVRKRLSQELGILPNHVFINASHCHSAVRSDAASLTVDAVKQAVQQLTPVWVGAGRGTEDRIQENRRIRLKDGSETDVRRAYSMPFDNEVASVGPIDPEIGLLRLDHTNGTPLVALYNFACHPIQGMPTGGNTADFPGVASRVIEENLGIGTTALFVQGCAGDINPAHYKAVHQPHDAEPLGNSLGLSVLRGYRTIQTTRDTTLRVVNRIVSVPLAQDTTQRIAKLELEQEKLVQSLAGTSLTFKTFLPLYIQHRVSGEFPQSFAARYLHEKQLGRPDLSLLDAENQTNLDAYLKNIHTMERLTRLQVNLALLRMHQRDHLSSGKTTLQAEIGGLRIGSFVLVTFPGELTVEIGLAIKKRARGPHTFVAGYTNGYLYYLPTEAQRRNTGYAQEDCDTLVAPEWRALFDEQLDVVLAQLTDGL